MSSFFEFSCVILGYLSAFLCLVLLVVVLGYKTIDYVCKRLNIIGPVVFFWRHGGDFRKWLKSDAGSYFLSYLSSHRKRGEHLKVRNEMIQTLINAGDWMSKPEGSKDFYKAKMNWEAIKKQADALVNMEDVYEDANKVAAEVA